ncbi:MAG TPA: phosphatase PAP2 family protein [Vicinamibacterales bacterium]|nr:phosphatase PAP2 family protein [Vicinamibacterales bacterium]
MKSALFPLLLAATVTVLIGVGVWMEPYFAGDVPATRAVQAAAPNPGWWARPISSLAPAPAKYFVMVITAVLAYVVAGWRGLALIAAFIAIEQYGAESTKAIFKRPRPSRDLIATASGSGYSFPSTTITFFCVTFGAVAMFAAHRRKARARWPLLAAMSTILALGCVARVALGAHWPSDVILTSVICLTWIWTANRLVLGRA